MAIGTAMAALSVMQAGVAAGQAIFGSRQQKKASAAADASMARQREMIQQGMVNQYSGLQVPTGAFDQATEQLQANVAEQSRMLQEGGAEAAIGGVGRLVGAAGEQQRKISTELGEQEFALDKMQAQEQARLEEAKYQGLLGLEQQQMMGAQQAAAEGRQNLMAGLGGIGSAFAGGISAMGQLQNQEEESNIQSGGYGYGPNGSY